MDIGDVIALAEQTIQVSILVSAPLLGFALVAGLSVSVFQALTQVHEIGLTFIVKIVTVALALVLFLPWLLENLVDFTATLIEEIPAMVG